MAYWIVDNDEEFENIDDLCDYLFDPDSYSYNHTYNRSSSCCQE